jgi:hypothetical protein
VGKSAILTQALLDFKDYVKRVKRNVIILTCVVGSPDLKAIFPGAALPSPFFGRALAATASSPESFSAQSVRPVFSGYALGQWCLSSARVGGIGSS